MSDTSEEIKNLPEIDFPEGLHGKIMRRVVFLRLRTPFIIITTILVLNILISGSRILITLDQRDTIGVISAALNGFELSADYLSAFMSTALDALPVWSLGIFAVNIFLIGYVLFIASQFRKINILKGRTS